MARIAMIGGGGLAKEIIETARMLGHEVVGIFAQKNTLEAYPHLGYLDEMLQKRHLFDRVHLAIGAVNAQGIAERRKIVEFLHTYGIEAQTLVSPHALVSPEARLGWGVYVGHRALISCDAQIGDFVSINHNAVIGHDVIIEENVSVAPLVFLGGGVHIKRDVMLGVRSTVRQGLSVGEGAVVGMGALVIKSAPAGATVLQMPSRIYKEER